MGKVFKYQQFDIIQEHAAMKVGTDSDLLGTLGMGGKNILDIGTGTGVLSLMMAQRFPEAQVTAVEIDDNAVRDASDNFSNSKFAERITLNHCPFQDYVKVMDENGKLGVFDSIICNPPYFDKSLEPTDLGRTRARHSSSLPFRTLAEGSFKLLSDGGVFSVCIPPEVLPDFHSECLFAGYTLKQTILVKTVPDRPVKRIILIHQKGMTGMPVTETYCMCNADRSRSEWYKNLMKDFLVNPH